MYGNIMERIAIRKDGAGRARNATLIDYIVLKQIWLQGGRDGECGQEGGRERERGRRGEKEGEKGSAG